MGTGFFFFFLFSIETVKEFSERREEGMSGLLLSAHPFTYALRTRTAMQTMHVAL